MNNKTKRQNRIRRHRRVRATVKGTSERPRISIFKSNKNIFVQFVDDKSGKTILGGRIDISKKTKDKETKTIKSSLLAESLAERAKEKGIKEAVFDRGGFKYHGRIKAVAEGLRKGGIKL